MIAYILSRVVNDVMIIDNELVEVIQIIGVYESAAKARDIGEGFFGVQEWKSYNSSAANLEQAEEENSEDTWEGISEEGKRIKVEAWSVE
jgi:hypothetical protein